MISEKEKKPARYSRILKNWRIVSAALTIFLLSGLIGCRYISLEEDSIGYGVTLQGKNLRNVTLYLPFPYYKGAPFKEVFEALKTNTEKRRLSGNVSLSLVETKHGTMLGVKIRELNGELSLETPPMKFKNKLQTLGMFNRRGVPVWLNPRIVGGRQVMERGTNTQRYRIKNTLIETLIFSDQSTVQVDLSFMAQETKSNMVVLTSVADYMFLVYRWDKNAKISVPIMLAKGWNSVRLEEGAQIR